MSSSYPYFPGNSTFLSSHELLKFNHAIGLLEGLDFLSWLVAETAMFGVFSLLILPSLYVLVRTRSRRTYNLLKLLAVVVLYTGATLDWVSQVLYMEDIAAVTNSVEHLVTRCITAYTRGEPCKRPEAATLTMKIAAKLVSGEFFRLGIPGVNCVSTVVLAINMFISDFIVLWRAWVLWKDNRAVSIISLVLLIGSVSMSVLATCDTCDPLKAPMNESVAQPYFRYDAAGLSAFVLSLVLNLWATSLIGCRAWQHRRRIQRDLRRSGPRTLVEKTMILFIESGVLYCALWIFVVADEAVEFDFVFRSPAPYMSPGQSRFSSAWSTFANGALLQVIGIYPTIVIVLVALEKPHLDRNFTYDRLPSVPSRRRSTASGPDQSCGHDHSEDAETVYLSCVENSEGDEADIGLERIV
ncbi:hypothetical protein OF83DRAFT_1085785 [Amylostereum chailletii]|nr:hypothetical protein OF83DRAFT_1085785 [Amylostereum chailletii]